MSNKNPTILDAVSRSNSAGKIEANAIAEILSTSNEILDDATFVQCNDGTGHKDVIRTGLPEPTWREMYGGVFSTKSETAPIRDATGMLEAYAEIDKALADQNGNTKEFRMSEDSAHIEGMNQTVKETLIYGNQALEGSKFTGLAPRFNTISGAASGKNIVDGGGTGSTNTSAYIVCWSPMTARMIYPQGSPAGLQFTDKEQETIYKADGSRYEAYVSHYKWDVGFALRDWRFAARLANIDVEDLTDDGEGGSAKLITGFVKLINKIPNLRMGRAAIYCNATVRTYLMLQMINKGNAFISMQELVTGKPKVLTFLGIPIRQVDEILNTEAQIV